jgi:hypothetical protein
MLLADAQARLSELMTMTVLFWDEIGPEWAATNETLLSEALAGVASAPDLAAYMAEIESAVTHYDMADDVDFDFDNSGAVVTLDDGTEVPYEEPAEEEPTDLEGDGITDMDLSVDFIDPLESRKPFVGVDEMCHMEV